MRRATMDGHRYTFDSLPTLLSLCRSGSQGRPLGRHRGTALGGAPAARIALTDLPLTTFLNEPLVPFESDEVTRSALLPALQRWPIGLLVIARHGQVAPGPLRARQPLKVNRLRPRPPAGAPK